MGSGNNHNNGYYNFIDPLGMMPGDKKKTSSGSGNSLTPPSAPTPQNEYAYNNGVLASSRVYDPTKNGYVDNTYLTPAQQQLQTSSTNGLNNVLSQTGQVANMSPDALQKGVDAYTAPQYAALDRAYNQALGQSQNDAASNGMSNSVGFNKYLGDVLDRNKAQGYADIAASGEQMRYQLPNMALQPLANAANIYNGAMNGTQAIQSANLAPSFSGSQAASDFASNNYQNQLNGFNASLGGQLFNGLTGTARNYANYRLPVGIGGF